MKYIRIPISVLAAMSLGLAAVAQDAPAESLEQRVDALVALQHAPGQPGGAAAVITSEAILLKKYYGLMNVEKQADIAPDTLFDLASVAKTFTAFAVMMLEEEGRLNLDDDIRDYLPELPEYAHPVPIRRLMQHTSGLPSTDVLRLLGGIPLDERWTQRDEIGLVKRYPHLNFRPNTRSLYSNAGYSLLAAVIERISGVGFPEFMTSNVFEPLDMTATFVNHENVEDIEKLATGYGKDGEDFAEISSFNDLSYGGGNVLTTLDDMIRWARNILRPAVGRGDFPHLISRPYNTLENGELIITTYGFYVRDHKGLKMVEHSGGVPGFRTQFMIIPEKDIAVILMFNNESINTRRLATGIADAIFEGTLKDDPPVERVAVEPDIGKIKVFAGRYLMPDGQELDFVVDDGVFRLVLPGGGTFELFAESANAFFLKAFDAQCSFTVSEDGTVNEMTWRQRGEVVRAERIERIRPLGEGGLPEYAGDYRLTELDAGYPVVFENGRLELRLPETFKKYLGFDRVELRHVNGDKFYTGPLGMLEFTRDGEGRISGFVLFDIGRVQNIRFAVL